VGVHVAHSLQYFLASLAGIARALDDLGYREDARQIFLVRKSLEAKMDPEGHGGADGKEGAA
jgi:hypothetical protein